MAINPDLYHGLTCGKKDFFEGWYIKLTSATGVAYAFIFGICTGDDPHSFIQVVDSTKKQTEYFRFEVDQFKSNPTTLNIKIDENNFSYHKLILALSKGKSQVIGSLNFRKITRWGDSSILPGSMGIFNHLDFLECYSQTCILDGLVSGCLWIDGKMVDFNGGSVYMEKNWGQSFPAAWFWCQSNNFLDTRAAFSISHGRVPFMGCYFDGLLASLVVDGKIYKFTTMNCSRIKLFYKENGCKGILLSSKYAVVFDINVKDCSPCPAPKLGNMSGSVDESISSHLKLTLYNKKDKSVIYSGSANNTGFELGGLWSR